MPSVVALSSVKESAVADHLSVSAAARSFKLVFGDVTGQEFVDVYLHQRPLLIQHADGRFADLLPLEALLSGIGLLRNCRAVFAGLRQATIYNRSDAEDLFDAGATICALGIDNISPAVGLLASEIRDFIAYRGDMSVKAYWSPSGAGFDPHYDTSVTTTLQLIGEKTWHYSLEPVERFPLQNSQYPLTEELQDRLEAAGHASATLRAGDVLCLPQGTVHWANACDGPSLAINLSFEYIDCGLASELAERVKAELLEEPNYRSSMSGDSRSALSRRSAAILRDAYQQLAKTFARLAADVDRR